jgi:CxxC motif-containing protein (DUF1111 family)
MPRFRLFWAAFWLPCLFAVALVAAASAPMLVGAQSAPTFHPRDPGVRGGDPGAGGALDGVSSDQLAFFNAGRDTFNEVDSVSGTIAGEEGVGLGPRFNMNSCAGCHAQPAVGGSSPLTNPQLTVANLHGATNQIPSFITANGPVREVRFVKNSDGSADGGVHDLFTIAGRSDAPGCTSAAIQQPNFAANFANGNAVFRIPTPTFGTGLIQAIQDDAIVKNLAANRGKMGVFGHVNREGNAGTITRFGWKAQNKSLSIFSGEAYLVEQGVSNELFSQERGEPDDRGIAQRVEPDPACLKNGSPEDQTNFPQAAPTAAMSDVQGFAMFMELSAPPKSVALSNSAANGQQLFNSIGCNLCHTPQLTTGPSRIAALNLKPVNLYSDLAVHHMGTGLADNVSQGSAVGDEFRTPPLWGLGQRVFFLHDGRTTDLNQAILAHASSGSEANRVINNYLDLGHGEQDILNFLRSL